MAKNIKVTSVSLTGALLDWAKKRAFEAHRGNFSGYVEGLIQRDKVNAKKKAA